MYSAVVNLLEFSITSRESLNFTENTIMLVFTYGLQAGTSHVRMEPSRRMREC